jgi:hypothetical protein
MSQMPTLEELWKAAVPAQRTFDPDLLRGVPDAVARFLTHAIVPGTPLASAVRLQMHGEIKLKRWMPFTASQVISWGRGFIWEASVGSGLLRIRGFDRLMCGEGAMRWKLLGMFPIMTAAGPDITRSAIGRVAAESIWLPAVLCSDAVAWVEHDGRHIQASLTLDHERAEIALTIADDGRVEAVSLPRWGNPMGAMAFQYVDFGGKVDAERTFGGYTIPTRVDVGYYPNDRRLWPDGEFFRAAIDTAEYR